MVRKRGLDHVDSFLLFQPWDGILLNYFYFYLTNHFIQIIVLHKSNNFHYYILLSFKLLFIVEEEEEEEEEAHRGKVRSKTILHMPLLLVSLPLFSTVRSISTVKISQFRSTNFPIFLTRYIIILISVLFDASLHSNFQNFNLMIFFLLGS